jgi:uncharacterized protein (TIGR04255 family)
VPGTVDVPFGDDELAEIQLDRAPLVRVVAQVRFPIIAAVSQQEFIVEFQEALRGVYPVLRAEKELGFVVTAEGVQESVGSSIWRFHDRDDEWRVSLAPTFLALETQQYRDRDDFLRRFGVVVQALGDTVAPQIWDRLGIRYVDRIEADEPLNELVRPEVLGILGSPLGGAILQQGLTQSQFSLGDDSAMLTRWGILPAGVTHDPSIGPSGRPAWILDLDMYRSSEEEFDPQRICDVAGVFSRRIYRFFRWTVTPEFLRRFGASDEELRVHGFQPR